MAAVLINPLMAVTHRNRIKMIILTIILILVISTRIIMINTMETVINRINFQMAADLEWDNKAALTRLQVEPDVYLPVSLNEYNCSNLY
jgi:hypothetical protein